MTMKVTQGQPVCASTQRTMRCVDNANSKLCFTQRLCNAEIAATDNGEKSTVDEL